MFLAGDGAAQPTRGCWLVAFALLGLRACGACPAPPPGCWRLSRLAPDRLGLGPGHERVPNAAVFLQRGAVAVTGGGLLVLAAAVPATARCRVARSLPDRWRPRYSAAVHGRHRHRHRVKPTPTQPSGRSGEWPRSRRSWRGARHSVNLTGEVRIDPGDALARRCFVGRRARPRCRGSVVALQSRHGDPGSPDRRPIGVLSRILTVYCMRGPRRPASTARSPSPCAPYGHSRPGLRLPRRRPRPARRGRLQRPAGSRYRGVALRPALCRVDAGGALATRSHRRRGIASRLPRRRSRRTGTGRGGWWRGRAGASRSADGRFRFAPEGNPSPQVALLASRFERYAASIQGIELGTAPESAAYGSP